MLGGGVGEETSPVIATYMNVHPGLYQRPFLTCRMSALIDWPTTCLISKETNRSYHWQSRDMSETRGPAIPDNHPDRKEDGTWGHTATASRLQSREREDTCRGVGGRDVSI